MGSRSDLGLVNVAFFFQRCFHKHELKATPACTVEATADACPPDQRLVKKNPGSGPAIADKGCLLPGKGISDPLPVESAHLQVLDLAWREITDLGCL